MTETWMTSKSKYAQNKRIWRSIMAWKISVGRLAMRIRALERFCGMELRPEEQEMIACYYDLPPAAVYISDKEKCKYPVEWWEE